MRLGDSIKTFMDRLARGDRVIVVLSDKYLRSHYCMYELFEIWLQARGEEDRFLKRIRVFTHDDAKIWTSIDRAKYAIHWKEEYEEHDELIKKHGITIFGDEDKIKISLMNKFSSHIGDILAVVAAILQPRTLDDLIAYSFDDGELDDH